MDFLRIVKDGVEVSDENEGEEMRIDLRFLLLLILVQVALPISLAFLVLF
jgi:hypothetical protein